MPIDINILIGGAAGQGIQTVGDLLVRVCRQAGLYVFAANSYESRIRGGHSNVRIRISDQPVQAYGRRIDLLLAMTDETLARHRQHLSDRGLIIQDSPEASSDKALHRVSITEMAEAAGGKIMANTVVAGACLSLLGAPIDMLEKALAVQFENTDDQAKSQNRAAAEKGFRAMKKIHFTGAFEWREAAASGLLMTGARALALGALAADVRLGAFYPMSPATGVMQYLSEISDNYPLVVEQAEDEIAAVNMVIGASFAGVRALTATSGGGFCLMTEGLGLAGITETPLVIINAQRPGPATGLPTRTAQGDLLFVINAAQDEFPRFVFAPQSVDEAYETMIRAFDLADHYQVPVIVLTDHYFNDMLTVSEGRFQAPEEIDRHLVSDADMDDPSQYRRYALAAEDVPDGVSPRALPCAGQALVTASGNEHSEDGHISEDKTNRVNMVNKRQAKLTAMAQEMRPPEGCHEDSPILLIGWGSSAGAVKEAVEWLRRDGIDAGCLTLTDLWPFPHQGFIDAASGAETLITVEANTTAQLGLLIRQQTGISADGAILKYDGRPLTPEDIVDGYTEFYGGNHG